MKLLDCPFCGASANKPDKISRSGRPVWEISCAWRCIGMKRGTKKEVIEDWNKRTPIVQKRVSESKPSDHTHR